MVSEDDSSPLLGQNQDHRNPPLPPNDRPEASRWSKRPMTDGEGGRRTGISKRADQTDGETITTMADVVDVAYVVVWDVGTKLQTGDFGRGSEGGRLI